MKTIFIINIPEYPPKFLVKDGDYKYLNNFFIGDNFIDDPDKSKFVADLIYYPTSGNERREVTSEFPLKVAKEKDSIVVVTGWLY